MRIRSIRPEFWTSEDVAAMDWNTRLVFIGLWSYVDDNGVGRDTERLITAALFPLDTDLQESSRRVTGALAHLSNHGQITRYEIDGKAYLHISAWAKHQRIEKASKGRYPLPTCENAEIAEPSGNTPVLLPDISPPGEGEKGRRGEGEKAASRRSPERPIPEDWKPKQSHAKFAEDNGLNLPAESMKFRNNAHAKEVRFRNWDAAFSNWLIKSVEFKPKQSPRAERTDLPEAWR